MPQRIRLEKLRFVRVYAVSVRIFYGRFAKSTELITNRTNNDCWVYERSDLYLTPKMTLFDSIRSGGALRFCCVSPYDSIIICAKCTLWCRCSEKRRAPPDRMLSKSVIFGVRYKSERSYIYICIYIWYLLPVMCVAVCASMCTDEMYWSIHF